MVVGSETFRHHTCVLALIEILITEADGKSLHPSPTRPCHQCHNNRRVHSPAEESSQRHITDQADTHSLCQPPLQFLQTLFLGSGVGPKGRYVPVLTRRDLAGRVLEQMSRRKLVNPLESSERVRNIGKVEVLQYPFGIDLGQLGGNGKNRLNLRTEK